MAKRFLRVSIDIPEDMLGRFWLDCYIPLRGSNPGIQPIAEPEDPKNPTRSNGGRALDVLLKAVTNGVAMLPDLKAHLVKAGFSPSSATFHIKELIKRDLITRAGRGMYTAKIPKSRKKK